MDRRWFLKMTGSSLAALAMGSCCSLRSGIQKQRPNVLFIAIDDMNDWIGPLANHLPKAKTPNIDRLTSKGVMFTNAHCASPVCHPSRTAVMTGVHPSRSGIISNVFSSKGEPTWRENEVLKDVETITQHFQNHGYKTFGTGKIYHSLQWWEGSECPADEWDAYWPSAEKPIPEWVRPNDLIPDEERGLIPGRPLGWSNQLFGAHPLDVPDEETSDYKVVQWGISQLKRKHETPFFLACGIFRPHIPWEVPQKYFDMYPLEEIKLPPHKEGDLKDAISHGRESWHKWVVENNMWEPLVQGYLACITYADAMLGLLLDGLEESEYKDNTIIVLWSDQGMHLGEKENWEKFTLWEESTRVPLFFSAPGITENGNKVDCPVSLIDIYPTLCELTDLPIPKQCDGESLVPLLKGVSVKRSKPVITTYRMQTKTLPNEPRIVGHAVRSERWRYIRYSNGFEELYDHENDPHEYTNLAKNPVYGDVIKQLAKYLPSFQ